MSAILKMLQNRAVEVELKSEVVEFGKIDELKKHEQELDKGRDELMQFATDAREAIAKGKREMDRLDSVNKVSKLLLGDVEKAAKDLGVDIKEIKGLKSAINAYDQQRKTLSKVLN
jgi:predicted translin family RNA/ssDNA-binding protein